MLLYVSSVVVLRTFIHSIIVAIFHFWSHGLKLNRTCYFDGCRVKWCVVYDMTSFNSNEMVKFGFDQFWR